MKILYIGSEDEHTTSRHRANALKRMGHDVMMYDPDKAMALSGIAIPFHYKTGYTLISERVRSHLNAWLRKSGARFDVAWVDSGNMINRRTVHDLKLISSRVINYNCDDPTGRRDGWRWQTFRRAISMYDLCVVVRRESEKEYVEYGANRVLKVWMAADEIAHAPKLLTPKIIAKWQSDVAFIGTWMPERGPFLAALVEKNVPLSIWGNRWQKAPEWPVLQKFWRGPALEGDDYAYAIQCAKISLGLLSKGNRDLHTTRSAEIPALGSLFCAERTNEHLALYEQGREAVFWSNVEECILTIHGILADPIKRFDIAEAGHRRWEGSSLKNEVIAGTILSNLTFL